MSKELDIGHGDIVTVGDKLLDAVEGSASQDQTTYLLSAEGKRIAAIVPVEVAEAADQAIAGVLATPFPSVSADPRSVVETDRAGAEQAAAQLEAAGDGYEPDEVAL